MSHIQRTWQVGANPAITWLNAIEADLTTSAALAEAIDAELGVDPAGPFATVVARLLAAEAVSINAKNPVYGALGDGSDDTAAIKAALAAAGAVAGLGYFGTTVILPPGNYEIHQHLNIPSGVRLRGAHKDATLIRANYDGTTPALDFQTHGIVRLGDGSVNPCFGSRVEDLTITGDAVSEIAVYTTQANEGSGVRNVRIRDFTQHAVKLARNGAADPVADCKILETIEIFAAAGAGVTPINVEHCAGAIAMDDISINMGTVATSPDGIKVTAAGNLILSNLHIEGCVDALDLGTGIAGDQYGMVNGLHSNHCTNAVHLQNAASAKGWALHSIRAQNHVASILDDLASVTLTDTWVPNYTTPGVGLNIGGVALLSGAGAPAAGLGKNGDLYARSDGGAGTCLYQKRAGAWVATAA